jgi:ABC-2 type transport system permease protein
MRLIASELLKIWTAPRTVLGLVLGELAIVAIGTASTIDSATSAGEGLPPGFAVEQGLPPDLERDLIGVASSALLFALILGILVVTWEYRHGTISQTFLATPGRERVIGAKAVVAALAGAALTIPALLLMLAISEIWIGGRAGFHFGGEELRLIARLLLAAALVGALGLAIGAATGRQLGAIVISFAWLAFGEHAVGMWSSVTDYLPGHAIGDVLGAEGGGGHSFVSALLTIGAYFLGLGALALALTHRRDIT